MRHCDRSVILSDMGPGHCLHPHWRPLSFEPIWQRLGIGAVLNALLQGRGLEFAVERAVFASVLRQLFVSGSDSTDFVARPSGR